MAFEGQTLSFYQTKAEVPCEILTPSVRLKRLTGKEIERFTSKTENPSIYQEHISPKSILSNCYELTKRPKRALKSTFKNDFEYVRPKRKYIPSGKRYNCSYCKEDFDTQKIASKHMTKEHQAEKVECEICHKTFYGENALQAHMKTKHQNEKIKVENIEIKTEPPDEIIANKIASDFFDFEFEDVKPKLETLDTVESSESTIDPEDWKFKCDQCDESFTGINGLMDHLNHAHEKTDVQTDVTTNLTESTTTGEVDSNGTIPFSSSITSSTGSLAYTFTTGTFTVACI